MVSPYSTVKFVDNCSMCAYVPVLGSIIVLCTAELVLMRKHHLVTVLKFLVSGSTIQPKYWFANQNRGAALALKNSEKPFENG